MMDRLDLPTSPASGRERRISLVSLQVEPENLMDPLGESSDLVYQPLKLVKIMENRYMDNRHFKGLRKTQGLTWVSPDTGFRESIFKNLLNSNSTNYSTTVEFLIVVTMHNEDVKNFKDTMIGISENLEAFKLAGISTKEICCVVIIDGIKPFLETYNKAKHFFSQFFDEQKIKDFFHVENLVDCRIPDETDEDEFAHCFMQLAKFDDLNELQLIFCVKQKNKRKLNTHLWFFGGFCEMFNPNYIMMLDVGTKPLEKSLFYLYEAMKTNSRVAGCCGEIVPFMPSFWNLTVGAQVVEYKFTHIFDKALESVIGYITILPGAFSAYRWSALQGDPLWECYFKSICHPELMDPFQSNISLAEDRVLCLALISKKNKNFILRYVKKSVAEIDVPQTISILMAKKRRWINGSWFALIDTIKRAESIYKSSHSCLRKCLFTLQMIYYTINVIFAWFKIAFLFVAFAVAVNLIIDDDRNSLTSFSSWIINTYVVLLVIIFILSIGVKPKRAEEVYKVIVCIFGVTMLIIVGLMLHLLLSNLYVDSWIIYLMAVSMCVFIVNAIAHSATLTLLKGIFYFVFLSPSYINIFLTYAICNIHDCTWGNRPDQQSDEERARSEEFEDFRTRWTIVWVLSNGAIGYYFYQDLSSSKSTAWNIYGVALIGFAILLIRFIGGTFYIIQEKCFQKSLKFAISHENESDFLLSQQRNNKVENWNDSAYPVITITEASGKTSEGMLDDWPIENSHQSPLFDLKRFRCEAGMSKKELEEATGIKKKTIRKFEFMCKKPTEAQEKELKEKVSVFNEEFRHNMKNLRKENHLKLKQLSKNTGIPKKRLREIEFGLQEADAKEKKLIKSTICSWSIV